MDREQELLEFELNHIYYRGYLKSCNYRCGYCPFCKHKSSQQELERDKGALFRFVDYLERLDQKISIMFLPYGEALIHPYYLEALAALSANKNIESVCIQTNASFNIDYLMTHIQQKDGNMKKIKFWCSFHPSQVSVEEFMGQCQRLYGKGFSFSVGAVGDYDAIKQLEELRNQLPTDIYMWINKKDGLKRNYHDYEVKQFLCIDPHFGMELYKQKADIKLCHGGKQSIFVNGKGDISACNISNGKIGNIYENKIQSPSCKSKSCRCYLAYSNRIDRRELGFFKKDYFNRILPKSNKKVIFFDVDGTLTDRNGIIPKQNQIAIEKMGRDYQLFLNTSLPFSKAFKKCKSIWPYLSGGSFANGSDIRIFSYEYKHIISMSQDILQIINTRKQRMFLEYEDNTLHKVGFIGGKGSLTAMLMKEEILNQYNIVFENGFVSMTDKSASKLKGAIWICRCFAINHKNVIPVGNSKNDKEVLSYFQNSVAVDTASTEIKKIAKYSCTISEIHKIVNGLPS